MGRRSNTIKAMDEAQEKLDGLIRDFLADPRVSDGGYAPVEEGDEGLLSELISALLRSKFEAILMGAASFEREFMGWMVLPSGKTVGDEIIAKLLDAKEGGQMPKALSEFEIEGS